MKKESQWTIFSGGVGLYPMHEKPTTERTKSVHFLVVLGSFWWWKPHEEAGFPVEFLLETGISILCTVLTSDQFPRDVP